MKPYLPLLAAAAFVFASCEARVNNPPAESNTTVVTPGSSEPARSETNETNVTNVTPAAPAPAPSTETRESTTTTTTGDGGGAVQQSTTTETRQ